MSLDTLSEYSVRFLRFRPISEHGRSYHSVPPHDKLLSLAELASQSKVLEKAVGKAKPRSEHPQNHPKITERELEERRRGRARFWAEELFPREMPKPGWRSRKSYPAPKGALTAVEAAARIGDVELIDELVEKGADVSFWQLPAQTEMPFPPTPSAMPVSSTLHGAVEVGKVGVVKHLLEKHRFNPNTFPLAAVIRCVSQETQL